MKVSRKDRESKKKSERHNCTTRDKQSWQQHMDNKLETEQI